MRKINPLNAEKAENKRPGISMMAIFSAVTDQTEMPEAESISIATKLTVNTIAEMRLISKTSIFDIFCH